MKTKQSCKFNSNIHCSFCDFCKKNPKIKKDNIEEIINIISKTDFEKIGLDLEIKKIIKKEGITNIELEKLKKDFKGYFWEKINIIDEEKFVVTIAKDKKYLEKGVFLEKKFQSSKKDYEKTNKKLGKMLGYPNCCIEHYHNFDILKDNETVSKIYGLYDVINLFEQTKGKLNESECSDTAGELCGLYNTESFICPLLNNITLFAPYFKCSYDCAKSIKLMNKLLANFFENKNEEKKEKVFSLLNTDYIYLSRKEKIYIEILKIKNNKIHYRLVDTNFIGKDDLTKTIEKGNVIEYQDNSILIKNDNKTLGTYKNGEIFVFNVGEKIDKNLINIMFSSFDKYEEFDLKYKILKTGNVVFKDYKIDYILINEKKDKIIIGLKNIRSKKLLKIYIQNKETENYLLKSGQLCLSYYYKEELNHKDLIVIKTIFSLIELRKKEIF